MDSHTLIQALIYLGAAAQLCPSPSVWGWGQCWAISSPAVLSARGRCGW